MNSGVLHTMQALASSLPIRVLEPDQVLFEAGEPGSSIFACSAVRLSFIGAKPVAKRLALAM